MRAVWIHVGIKSIFIRTHTAPQRVRLICNQFYLDNRFNGFETILPWDDKPDWSTIRIWHGQSVKAGRQNGQIVHRFVEAQTLLVRPGVERTILTGHFLWAIDG